MNLPQESSSYRPDVDGLRAIAVVAVVLFHAEIGILSGGFIGVDIFFVISGFLITRIIDREVREGRFSLLKFYERRARRIFPALVAVVLFCILFGGLLYLPEDFSALALSAISALFFFSNFYFWREQNNYFAAEPEHSPLLHTWSLGVEEQFYIAFPILLILAHRLFAKRISLIVLLGGLMSLALAIYLVETRPSAAFYMMPSRFWELGIGAYCAIREERLQQLVKPYASAAAWMGLAMIVAPIFLYDELTAFPGLAAIPVCLGASLLIVAGGAKATIPSKFLSMPGMLVIGLASYSIYLWHWPILTIADLAPWPIAWREPIKVGALLLTFLIGYLSYRYIEGPFRNRERFSPSAIWKLTGLSFAALSAVAIGIFLSSGMPQRIDAKDREAILAAAQREPHVDCAQFSRAVNFEICPIGAEEAEPTFVLFGDSHARMFSWGIDIAAQNRGRAGHLVGAGACPPLLPVETDTDCGFHRQKLFSFLEENPQIETVILAGYWLHYFEANRFQFGNHNRIRGFDQEDYLELYADTIRHLTASGRMVYVLEDAPQLTRDLPQTETLSGLLGVELDAGISRSQYLADNALPSLMMRSVDADNYVIVPAIDVLCQDACIVRSEDELYYRDSHHITKQTSERFFAEHFERLIFAP